ncbi:MAG: zinc-binding dehydrogenase [Nitrososphaerota archaeon]|nr:zinc-binding dehydrogenase [Candidatus Calditenuaceae archaeon]MDW8073574.1 zinc-binding dehydrogenase [Nitrososphaerota archaeon]
MKTHIVACVNPLDVRVVESELPSVGAGEFLVRASITAISTGTELTLYTGEYPAGSVWQSIAKYPLNLGYCHLGDVVEVGEGVKDLSVGERVVGWKPHSMYAVYGGGDSWVKVPEDVADEEAVVTNLATISINAVRRAKIRLGECVVVYGLGPIGVLAALFSKLSGGFPVIGVDLYERRRRLAERIGAVHFTLDGGDSAVADKVRELNRGRLADVVFEATGSPSAFLAEFQALRRQGRMIILSSPRGPVPFDFHDLCNWPSHTIIGAHVASHPESETPDNPWTRRRNGELYLDLVKSGTISLKSLVTHRFKWRDAAQAYRLLHQERGTTGIVLLDWR